MLLVTVYAALLFQDGQANEAALREVFAREYKDRDPARRIEAIRRLNALHEEKTLLTLAGALRDPAVGVRTAAAEVIGTCTDVSGSAIKGLCATLVNKKENKDVRLACARSLKLVQYKAEAIDALIQTISGIAEQDKDLFPFGVECTGVLIWLTSQDFGFGKETAEKWKKWWVKNKARIVRDDQEKFDAYRKSAGVKGK